ncbi:MAG: isochorismatase family protein, partial [Tabrizicola sp.]|nr:isochorismatase family protein [Tabrizicola sp.]
MSPAVLVIDMQMGMAHRIAEGRLPVSAEAEATIARCLAWARGAGVPVIHVHHDDPDPASPFGKGRPGARR